MSDCTALQYRCELMRAIQREPQMSSPIPLNAWVVEHTDTRIRHSNRRPYAKASATEK